MSDSTNISINQNSKDVAQLKKIPKTKEKKKESKDDLLYFIENINQIKNNVNYYNHKLIKLIYNLYFEENSKIPFEVFKDSIFKNKKKGVNKKINDNEIKDIIKEKDNNEFNRCEFLIYNKGNVRYCKQKKSGESNFCRFHQE